MRIESVVYTWTAIIGILVFNVFIMSISNCLMCKRVDIIELRLKEIKLDESR